MKITDFKIGKTIYVPIINKSAHMSTGNNIIGSDRFIKYKIVPLKVIDVQRIEYPSGYEDNCEIKPWYDGFCATVINLDTSSLSDIERDNYYHTYERHGYHPCMWDGSCTDKFQQYVGYICFPDKMEQSDDDYQYYVLNSMLSTNKKDAAKALRKQAKLELGYIKSIIANYKMTYKEVKKWLKQETNF